jgi:hypothetical protein
MSGGSGWRRSRHVDGWVIRPVDRDDNLPPQRYDPGLVLTTTGEFYRLDNQVRGYGTRDFPTYHHTVAPEPMDAPVAARLIAELDAVLADNGVKTRG